jgi:hypothetical protein
VTSFELWQEVHFACRHAEERLRSKLLDHGADAFDEIERVKALRMEANRLLTVMLAENEASASRLDRHSTVRP